MARTVAREHQPCERDLSRATRCFRTYRPTYGRSELPHQAAAGNQRQIERAELPRRSRAHSRNRVHEPSRRSDDAGITLSRTRTHLHVALVTRRAGDDDAVSARADRLWPIRTQVVVETRDVLDDDARFAADDALHLEP